MKVVYLAAISGRASADPDAAGLPFEIPYQVAVFFSSLKMTRSLAGKGFVEIVSRLGSGLPRR